MINSTRYDQQAAYVVPISVTAQVQQPPASSTPPAQAATVATVTAVTPESSQLVPVPSYLNYNANNAWNSSVAYATATPLPYPPNVDVNSTQSYQSQFSTDPHSNNTSSTAIVRAERSVGHRLDNHFQLRNTDNSNSGFYNRINVNNNIGIREYSSLQRWRDSLFSCWHQLYPSCFCAIFCPCILVGDITATIKYMPFIFSFSIFITLFLVAIFLFATKVGWGGALLTWGFLSVFVASIRKKIRLQNNFQLGNDKEDFFVACFCMSCVIAQMARHIFHYKRVVECTHYPLNSSYGSSNNNNYIVRRYSHNYPSRTNRIPSIRSHSHSTITSVRGSRTGFSGSLAPTLSRPSDYIHSRSRDGARSSLPSATVTTLPRPVLAQIAHIEPAPRDI